MDHSRVARFRRSLTPARFLVLSFLGLVAFGTAGLMWIPGLYVGPSLSWLDALFTATSAVCITGLIVVDTATYFTTWGQAFILLLIQLGGLGILTLTTLVILTLGRRLSLHHEAVTASAVQVAPDLDFRRLVRDVVGFTLLAEAVGAMLLFLAWGPRFGTTEGAWHAVFQAVSAFCNAGFSTFSDSLVGFQNSPWVLSVVMALVVLGGIGFLTLEELHQRWKRAAERRPRLSLHSRMVLVVTGILLVVGWGVYATLEWNNTLAHMPSWGKALNGLFMSVTARTAGFNTIDYAAAGDSTNFFTVLLMSIGGSPGSTAGGLKTTTAAVIALLAVARLRGHETTAAGARSIPPETIDRAIGLFAVGFIVVTGAILLLAFLQLPPGATPGPGRFLTYMFEAVSAFNTVGLSMGGTGELSSAAKLLTVILMFVGRVGPLTVVAALARRRRRSGGFRYAREDVIIG